MWFQNIDDKDICSFKTFDIVDLYPSVSKDLLINAINFAKSITPTDDRIVKTILHARKPLLFNKNKVWIKKHNPDFDATMGSFDGVEVCELVGFYLLDILRKEFGHNKIGFSREDGLSCVQKFSGPESEKIKKKLCKIFKKHGLNMTVACNLRITDFLDDTFDLQTGNKTHTGKPRMNYHIFTSNQTTHHPSPSKFLP